MRGQAISLLIPFTWGVASLPMPGQDVSGDRYLIRPRPRGLLVAAVDGLGHGPAAAAAADTAVAILEGHLLQPVTQMVEACHKALLRTRGVALTVASFDLQRGAMTWLGVGNVEGILVRADPGASPAGENLILRGGVVGYSLPPLRPTFTPVAAGDTLILATDGIRSRFAEGLNLRDSPQAIADGILARHAKGTDDALVVVAQYLGGQP